MNETTTPPPPDTGPRVTREAIRDISTLRRSRDQRMVAGVAEGLSRHLDIDPIVIRVVLAALTLFGGAGLLIYVIAWATIPEEGNDQSGVSSLLRRDPDRVMIAGLSMAAVVGALTALTTIGWSSPNPFGLVVVGVLALVAIAWLSRRSDKQPTPPWTPPQPWPSPQGGPASPGATTSPTSSSAIDEETELLAEPTPQRAWWQRDQAPGSPTPPPPPHQATAPPPPMTPREPRSHLFGLTMAVIAIALGSLWLLDATVIDDMPPAIYPATALAITAIALVISTWFGRSRLLILVGVLTSFITVASTAIGPGPIGDRVYRPQTVAALDSQYEHGAGRIVLDLQDLTDPENLDGQTVHIDSRIGQLHVVIPSSISVSIDANVEAGRVEGPRSGVIAYDGDRGGQSASISSASPGESADLFLDLDLKVGQILITAFNCGPAGPFETRYVLPTTSNQGGTSAAPACN